MADNQNKTLRKYALDSSAVFYPFFTTKTTQSMYCVGAILKDAVDGDILKSALNDALLRFPLYKTRVKRGYGAYLLQENRAEAKAFKMDGKVLRPIDVKETNGYQFRLAYEGCRITLEVFHALTDANGAIKLLGAVIRRYRELTGVKFKDDCGVFAYDSPHPEHELEDGFKKYYKRIGLNQLNLKGMTGEHPHRISGTLLKDGYKLEYGTADTAEFIAQAKSRGVSLTAFIAGAVAYGILKSGDVKRPIVIMVPVNLRKLFPTETLSNFVTFVRLIVKRSEVKTFDDCVRLCAAQLTEKASKDKMQAFISTTVRAQKNIIFRMIPLGLKWIFIRLGRLFLKSRQTIIISNLGNIELPDEMGVEQITMNLNVSKNNVQNLGIVSYEGSCRLTFTSAIEQLDMPSAVFDTLEENNIKITKNAVYRVK